MKKYKIVGGKLLDGDNNPVQLKIGDPDQIKFIKECIAYAEAFEGEGLLLDVYVETIHTASTQFKCVCGQWLFIEDNIDDPDDDSWIIGRKKKCGNCEKEYVVEQNSDGLSVVKPKRHKPI